MSVYDLAMFNASSERAMLQLKSNCPEIKWIIRNAATNDFARSCDNYLLRTGTLTQPMFDAVRNGLQRITQAADVSGAGVDRIVAAFASARANKVARPKMYLGDFLFKFATSGRHKGGIWVTQDGEYLGAISQGRFFATSACSDEQREAIIKVCADPAGEAVAFGMRTGICSCCGRPLTNGESIDRGIGPICAEKYGFF